MTSIPQMECCTMLGIDPKTLRHWLRHAHLQFVAHPTDARLTCLTPEQVQQLADLHARPISLASTLSPLSPTQENETQLAAAPASFSQEVDLRKLVCGLEAKVMTLQEQLTQLTLELLRERVSAV